MAGRLRPTVGVAVAQLRHYRVRTLLTVLAVTLAVLSTTLLAGVGVGVLQTGQEKLNAANRDLWVTGGPMRITPGAVGTFQNGITDAHGVAAEMRVRDDVAVAVPIAFQTVYVGSDPDHLQTVVGVGVPGGGPAVSVTRGAGFHAGDVHYADGNYTGPMTHQLLVDERTARQYDVDVGDHLYVGGTVANARQNRFTIVGISPTFSRFLGAPTVTMHLSELQTLTGTEGTDRASLITVTVADGADPVVVRDSLARDYPQFRVRTNREQLQAVLQERIVVLAAAVTLVVVAVLSGVALTTNALAMTVYQQRRELAAIEAAGVAPGTLVGVVGAQALLLGLVGGGLGLALTPVAARLVGLVAQRLVGFSGLVRTPPWIFLAGLAIAVGISLVSAAVAGWRVTRLSPLAHLR